MDYKEDLDKSGGATAKIHKIRITLTSRNVKPLEKCELVCTARRGQESLARRWNGRQRKGREEFERWQELEDGIEGRRNSGADSGRGKDILIMLSDCR